MSAVRGDLLKGSVLSLQREGGWKGWSVGEGEGEGERGKSSG